MSLESRPTIPTTTAVASANAANNLTITLAAEQDKRFFIHGISVGYTGTAGGAIEITTSPSSGVTNVIWNGVSVGDAPSHDFSSGPIKTTETSTLQVVCPQPRGTDDGRATIRYSIGN